MKRLALNIAAPLLCVLSASCSIYLWASEQSTVETMVLFGGFALGLELCKFGFFPWARELKGIWSAALYLVAFVLVLISVGATVSLLETGAINNMSQARTSSDSYQSAKNTVESLELEIRTLQGLIKEDAKHDYRGRALSQSDRLAELRKSKNTAIVAMRNVEIAPASGMQSSFITVATQLNVSVSAVRFWTYAVVAITIDVLAIICIMLLSAPATTNATNSLQVIAPVIAPVIADCNEAESSAMNDCNETKSSATNNYELIMSEINRGSFGNKFGVTNVMDALELRHHKAKTILENFCNEGQLVRVGKSYKVVEV